MPRARKGRTPAGGPGHDRGAAVAAVALGAALAASALLVDPGADASFDAPKRLASLLLIALAAAAAFLPRRPRGALADLWHSAGPLPKAASILAAAALCGAVASAWLSPRRALALDSLRPLLVFALLLPLGASRVIPRYGRALLSVFLALAAFNAAVSLAQGRRLFQPFAVDVSGARDATGAFVGNVGYLALALALAAVAALAVALETRRPALRWLCAAALPLFLADLVVNQNLTSLTALAAGTAALAWARLGKRAAPAAVAAVLVVAGGIWLYHPARRRAAEAIGAARAGNWDSVLTYRLGPWSAAVQMFRERPAVGFGPGTFGAEFVPHRLKAELAARRRFVNPLVTSSYSEAHSEPLQALAEGGLAGLAAVAAALSLLGALGRTARRGGARAEAALLLALLVAGSVGALTWFPLQRPVSSIPLLLAAGRGWRLAVEGEGEAP